MAPGWLHHLPSRAIKIRKPATMMIDLLSDVAYAIQHPTSQHVDPSPNPLLGRR
jgi:hypothetical protein